MAVRVIRKFRNLLDVVFGSPADGDVVTYDSGTDRLILAPPTGGGGGPPTGPAGGVLSGTYPDPGFAADMATQAELDTVVAAAVNDGDPAGGVLGGTYPNPGFAVDMATQTELNAHINDATDAHDASAVSVSSLAENDVESALVALDAAITADETALAAHLADATDAHDASAISSIAAGGLAATNVQTALDELDTEKVSTSRTLTAGAALTGGGTLEADRTFDVAVDGSTIEVSADALRVKDAGITAVKLASRAIRRPVFIPITDPGVAATTGDAKKSFVIPPELDGYDLVDADAVVTTASSSGTPTFAVRRERSGSAIDMLSTNITIDANEKTSYTATTPAIINGSNDDVATGDIIYIDVDVIGTGAAGFGAILVFA